MAVLALIGAAGAYVLMRRWRGGLVVGTESPLGGSNAPNLRILPILIPLKARSGGDQLELG